MASKKTSIIRVYGFILNEEDEILISEEFHYNTFMRKFPGGGKEEGEDEEMCLRRELKEELGFDLLIEELVYSTPEYVNSAFNKSIQVKGVYYKVNLDPEMLMLYREDYHQPSTNGEERFKWVKLKTIHKMDFTFKTDQDAFAYLMAEKK